MSTKTEEPLNAKESSLFPHAKDVIGFLDTLIQIILPKHTVVIIILGIMGYFLFYPMVHDVNTYKGLMGGTQWSPFMSIYFSFGFVYLVGGMGLTYIINSTEQKNEFELKKAEIESLQYGDERGLVDTVTEYLVNNLGFPKEQIKKDVSLKVGKGGVSLDLATYGENKSSLLAVVETKWSKREIQIATEQIKALISMASTEGAKGGYLFIRDNNRFDVRFYNSNGTETGVAPTYEELLKMTVKTK